MKMFDDLQRRLQQGDTRDTVEHLAESGDAQRLSRTVSPEEIRKAVEAGDTGALQRLFARALSTPEGRRLAGQLGQMLDGK